MRKLFSFVLMLFLSLAVHGEQSHPILTLGSPAPDFALPGVDGKVHTLKDYAAKRVVVVVFTCNHCPIAQMYERRIEQLYEDYGKRSVAIVAIQGNDPKALTIDELDSSYISDTLDDMKIRAQYKHLAYPYLYDGATQSVTRAYGPQATPHYSSSIRTAASATKAASTTVIGWKWSKPRMRATRLKHSWPAKKFQ